MDISLVWLKLVLSHTRWLDSHHLRQVLGHIEIKLRCFYFD